MASHKIDDDAAAMPPTTPVPTGCGSTDTVAIIGSPLIQVTASRSDIPVAEAIVSPDRAEACHPVLVEPVCDDRPAALAATHASEPTTGTP